MFLYNLFEETPKKNILNDCTRSSSLELFNAVSLKQNKYAPTIKILGSEGSNIFKIIQLILNPFALAPFRLIKIKLKQNNFNCTCDLEEFYILKIATDSKSFKVKICKIGY